MAWWRPECPVRPMEQRWIDESMTWLAEQFGRDRLLGVVVLPTDDFFPGVYQGSRTDVEHVVGRLCQHMGLDRHQLTVEFDQPSRQERDADQLSAVLPLTTQSRGAAGHYRERDGKPVIAIRADQARRPMALVATVAHELGHVLLLGQHRITAGSQDHEPLTDLLTVYFGLGIFGANAAFDYSSEARGELTYRMTRRTGYLTEPMWGYGLARYAFMREEADPPWSSFLDTNPGTFLKQGLRYLHHLGKPAVPTDPSGPAG